MERSTQRIITFISKVTLVQEILRCVRKNSLTQDDSPCRKEMIKNLYPACHPERRGGDLEVEGSQKVQLANLQIVCKANLQLRNTKKDNAKQINDRWFRSFILKTQCDSTRELRRSGFSFPSPNCTLQGSFRGVVCGVAWRVLWRGDLPVRPI